MRQKRVIAWLAGACLLCLACGGASLQPTRLRQLDLEVPLLRGLPRHLAAASGLARVGDRWLVIGDDALALAVFQGQAPGRLFPLLERAPLPLDPKQRKRLKPDFEACALVSHETGRGLLVLGSGSRLNRRTGVFVRLSPEGEPEEAREFDLAPLYQELDRHFPTVNIEGAAVLAERLRLAQRGNAKGGGNALVDLDLPAAVARAARGAPWGPELVLGQRPLELGQAAQVPFTVTDLFGLPDGSCIFTAAAENTLDPVEDGRVVAAALGRLSPTGQVTEQLLIEPTAKCEGLWVEGRQAWLVTDADDPWEPAALLRAALPWEKSPMTDL